MSGLGLIKGFHCPHYHYEDREQKFKEMVLRRGGHGIAMTDGAGISVVDGQYRGNHVHAMGPTSSRSRRVRGRIVEAVIPVNEESSPQGGNVRFSGRTQMKWSLLFVVSSLIGGITVNAQGTQPAASQPTAPASASQSAADLTPFFTPPPEFRGKLGDYRSVLKFDDGRPVKTTADWSARRQEILKYWHEMMAPWPDLLANPAIQFLSKEHVENFTRCKVRIEVAAGDLQTAYLLIPDGAGPFPAVLVVWYDSASSAGLGKNGPRGIRRSATNWPNGVS